VIERAIILCKSDTISPIDLPSTFQSLPTLSSGLLGIKDLEMSAWKTKTLSEVKDLVLNQIEKKYLEMILEKTGGKIGDAAKIAGIHPRGLYGKMKKLGLDKSSYKTRSS